MIYKVVRMNVPSKEGRVNKYYARAVAAGRSTLSMISDAISAKTTVTPTDVKAVVDALWREIRDRLRQGQIVEIGELGNFQLTIYNKRGAATAKEYTTDLIKSISIKYNATKTMKSIADNVSLVRWENPSEQVANQAVRLAENNLAKARQKLKEDEELSQQAQIDAKANREDTSKKALVAMLDKQLEVDRQKLREAEEDLARKQNARQTLLDSLEELQGYRLVHTDDGDEIIENKP